MSIRYFEQLQTMHCQGDEKRHAVVSVLIIIVNVKFGVQIHSKEAANDLNPIDL